MGFDITIKIEWIEFAKWRISWLSESLFNGLKTHSHERNWIFTLVCL